MTWREVIDRSTGFLLAKGVDDGASAVEFLAARLLGCGRGTLAPALDRTLSEKHLDAMRRGVRRLAAHEPVQYILGEWDFRALTLACDRRALIPRPETEGLVSLVLAHLAARTWSEPPAVVDVGTGTGAIILSLAREHPGDAALLGTDVSADALELARANAARTGLADRVRFVCMDGLDDFDEPSLFDVIVSNPPYIASATCDALDRRVRDYEPRLALDGGPNGLDFYDRYLADALNLLRPNGAVFFEIGEEQGEAVRHLMSGYGFTDIRLGRDLAGRTRYASATLA